MSSLQIVHMGWACESPEDGGAGQTSAFKFLALKGPHFLIFKSPPVISLLFTFRVKMFLNF